MISPYNTQIVLPEYSTNSQYRQSLRLLFRMNNEQYKEKIAVLQQQLGDDLDDETKDETEFDDTAATDAMDYIYEKTKDSALFQQIYSAAAAKMMSIDPNIGLAVCFSFDYLDTFHSCIMTYFNEPDTFNETCSQYVTMMNKL
jgi:hypothetical protein|uniref:Uncharacterized protein n=1 Tax=viral metagenome TaxID=1070528 RepID=A0A6C0INE8_9ZZZZ